MSNKNFVVFEGIDGSGKSTAAELVYEALLYEYGAARFDNIHLEFEPTNRAVGKLVRNYLNKGGADINMFGLLFAADRYDHYYNYIKPLLDKGDIVLCDRYKMSALAYQSTMGLSFERLRHMDTVPEPGLTILLDLPIEVSMARLADGRNNLDVFEVEEKQRKIREAYLKVAADKTIYNGKVVVVDANRSIQEIEKECTEVVLSYL